MMFFQSRHVSERALSAFLDDRLEMPARDRVAQHLDACADCRAAEAELRALRSALGALPEVHAPRGFALREADVRATAAARPGLLVQAMPLLSGMTALALFTFVALVSIELLSGSSTSGGAKTTTGQFAARQENYGAVAPSVATKDLTAQAFDTAQSATTAPGSAFVVTAGAPSPTAAPGDVEQLTATVSAPAAPGTGAATPTAPSEAPPLSGPNPSPTALDQTEAVAPIVLTPTPTPQPTPPREPADSPAALNEATVPAGPETALKEAGRPVPTLTAQTTRTPAPIATAAANAPQGASGSGDTRLHAAEAALAAVAIVSGGGLFFAWRRRAS